MWEAWKVSTKYFYLDLDRPIKIYPNIKAVSAVHSEPNWPLFRSDGRNPQKYYETRRWLPVVYIYQIKSWYWKHLVSAVGY